MLKRKLLLADDSITIQKVVNLTFANENIDVISVGDGNSAMDKFREDMPDLVMADVNMPGLNGYEICEKIKQTGDENQTPVILLVGSFEPFDEAEAKRVGADDYLTKPFQSINQLVTRVSTLLDVEENAANSSVTETSEAETFDFSANPPDPPIYGGFGGDDEIIQTDQIGSLPVDDVSKFEANSPVEELEDNFSKDFEISSQEEKDFSFEKTDNIETISFDEEDAEAETENIISFTNDEIEDEEDSDRDMTEFSIVEPEEFEPNYENKLEIEKEIDLEDEISSLSKTEDNFEEEKVENTNINLKETTELTKADFFSLFKIDEKNPLELSSMEKQVNELSEQLSKESDTSVIEIENLDEKNESVFEEETSSEISAENIEVKETSGESIEKEVEEETVSKELVDEVAKQVFESLSDETIKEIAREVIFEKTDVIIKKMAEEKMKD